MDEPLTGNYFVSAYPPFSCWTGAGLEPFRNHLRTPAASTADAGPGLYVHVPFCVQRCPYCYYLAFDDRPKQIERYVEALIQEITLYAETPAFSERRVSFVYFGGGTPSLLAAQRISKLLGGLKRVLPWAKGCEVTFECAPKSVTLPKLRALAEAGVNRISLGIQQLDDGVLRQNGRIHLVEDVERAYASIRRVGFEQVNVDLMVGLLGETDETFGRSLRRVIELAPESVTIYQLEIPFNTPLYHALREGKLSTVPAPWELKRARLGGAFKRLEAAGYTVNSAYAAVDDPTRHRFVYQQNQYRGADLLGIGVSAFSYLAGIHQQNLTSLPDYLKVLEGGELPLGRAYALSDEERLVREFVLQLKLGTVGTEPFRRKFGVDVAERFAKPLARLIADGYAEVGGGAVALTREGLLRADRILPAFYLPEHRDVRYS